MTRVQAPFTPEQVQRLNERQCGVESAMLFHPFTCANRGDGAHGKEGGGTGILIATEQGWVCSHCSYTQDWAHAAMVKSLVGNGLMPAFMEDMWQKDLRSRLLGYIDAYKALYSSRRLSINQTEEQNANTQRIWTVVPVMLASLNRRLLALDGLQPNAGRPGLAAHPGEPWSAVAGGKPTVKGTVMTLMAVEGVKNPLHPGFGTDVWMEPTTVDDLGFFCEMIQTGHVTHWRALTESEKAEAMAATILYPDGRVENIPLPLDDSDRLKRLQEIVGGFIEHVALSDDLSLVLNENGKDGPHERNGRATDMARASLSIIDGDYIAGVAILLPAELLE